MLGKKNILACQICKGCAKFIKARTIYLILKGFINLRSSKKLNISAMLDTFYPL